MDELIKIGIITSSHGIRGEVKVYPTTDDVNRFKKLKECIIATKKENITVHIESCKFFKNMVILKFKEYSNINDIEVFRQCDLYVTRENAVKCNKDEYFIGDMIDSLVIDEDGQKIGNLVDVLSTGANDVYVIKQENDKEILIPAIKQCIISVDVENKVITVHLMEGLVD